MQSLTLHLCFNFNFVWLIFLANVLLFLIFNIELLCRVATFTPLRKRYSNDHALIGSRISRCTKLAMLWESKGNGHCHLVILIFDISSWVYQTWWSSNAAKGSSAMADGAQLVDFYIMDCEWSVTVIGPQRPFPSYQ